MTKEEIVSEVGKPVLRPLGFLQGMFLLALMGSPFVLIWISWSIAWKVGLTGVLGILIISPIYDFAKRRIGEYVEEAMNNLKEGKHKSKFNERIEKLQNL